VSDLERCLWEYIDRVERLVRTVIDSLRCPEVPIHYTGPMRAALNADVQLRFERSLAEFPELVNRSITVGLTKSADGTAEIEKMTIRLNVRRRRPVSYFTIGHELTHLLQHGGLGIVPSGEVQCDVWTLARSELFLDDQPTYLCPHLWSRENWLQHARPVRDLCQQAIAFRTANRQYLVWLTKALKQHVRTMSSLAGGRRSEGQPMHSASFRKA
jgi:hypothetical protein